MRLISKALLATIFVFVAGCASDPELENSERFGLSWLTRPVNSDFSEQRNQVKIATIFLEQSFEPNLVARLATDLTIEPPRMWNLDGPDQPTIFKAGSLLLATSGGINGEQIYCDPHVSLPHRFRRACVVDTNADGVFDFSKWAISNNDNEFRPFVAYGNFPISAAYVSDQANELKMMSGGPQFARNLSADYWVELAILGQTGPAGLSTEESLRSGLRRVKKGVTMDAYGTMFRAEDLPVTLEAPGFAITVLAISDETVSYALKPRALDGKPVLISYDGSLPRPDKAVN